MKIYTLKPGIAALVWVTDGCDRWLVIYLAADKPLHVNKDYSPRSTPEDLPLAVHKSCAVWFARVFDLPVEKRGEFIKTYGSPWKVEA